MHLKGAISLLAIYLFTALQLFAQPSQDEETPIKGLGNAKFSGQWFLSYQVFDEPIETRNAFTLRRGYLTFTKDFNKTLSIRFTQDITLDEEGSDAGNIEMRLKYCYLRVNTTMVDFLQHGYFEIGLVHRPWLEFEEKINRYRVQGTMFLERERIMNSADFGITYVSLIGGKLEKEYRSGSQQSYLGKFGSVSFGVYNGGGYTAIEYNGNKTFEGRLSLRPLPEYIPGLQFSYHLVRGKGNISQAPTFKLDHGFVSFENKILSITGQYYNGIGNSSGDFVDDSLQAIPVSGTSLFGEIRHPHNGLAVFSRYDHNDKKNVTSLVAGVAYYFLENSKAILNIDEQQTPQGKRWIYEAAIELRF